MSEEEVCITTVVTRLWGNQMAMCEALHALTLLLKTGHPDRADNVMQLSNRPLDSIYVIEPAVKALVEISGRGLQPANDGDGGVALADTLASTTSKRASSQLNCST